MKVAAACLVMLALQQAQRPKSVRDALLFGGFGYSNYEAIADAAAAARWQEIQRRASFAMSRLRPPPEHAGAIKLVWEKRLHYERLFNAVSVRGGLRDDELWVAEEAVDFVEGMRPCYEWEGFSECPWREAEFADVWLRLHPRSRFAAYLPLFAGNRWICAADGFDLEKESAKAADARRRATDRLTQAAAGKDPLFALVAKQMLADPRCFTSPY